MDALGPDARVLNVEMSMGQLVYDVKLAAEGSRPVEFYGTAGGIVPSPDEVADRIRKLVK
jgi:2-oxoglutarate ferredoxin oxidoreductase subunit alpha